jgi:integrase
MDRVGKMPIAKFDSDFWDKMALDYGNQAANIRNVLSHFLKYCAKKKYRSSLLILDLPKIKRRKRRILEPHEIEAIWAHAEGGLRLFITFALALGMRRSEIMTLEWEQIYFDRNALYLPESKTKTKKGRWVTLPPSVLTALKARREEMSGKTWVFPHLTKRNAHAHLDGFKSAWKVCLRRAFNVDLKKGEKLPNITWHDLRATCEFYAHKRTDISSTQLEKFFGADVEVQRRIYVQGDAEFVRGVENSQLLPTDNLVVVKPEDSEK